MGLKQKEKREKPLLLEENNNRMLLTKAYAKINIGLKVVGKDEKDGYHYVDMVTLPLELHDRIEIEIIPNNYDTILTCDDKSIPTDESNTVYKAVKAMKEKYGFKTKLRIHIHKNIPHCSGLGGGSADAAAVILGLNKILKLRATLEELCELGAQVGSDVPLCIINRPAHVTGKGEIIKPFKLKKGYYVLLCKPNKGLVTKDVYHQYDLLNTKLNKDNFSLIKGLETDNFEEINSNYGNELEEAAISLNHDVEIIKEMMKKAGCDLVFMTGSGACVCGLSRNLKKLENLQSSLDNNKFDTEITKILY